MRGTHSAPYGEPGHEHGRSQAREDGFKAGRLLPPSPSQHGAAAVYKDVGRAHRMGDREGVRLAYRLVQALAVVARRKAIDSPGTAGDVRVRALRAGKQI